MLIETEETLNHTTQGNPFRSDRTDNRRLLKFMLALGIVITLAVGFMLSTTRIARAETPPNGDPGGALVVDNGTHTIAGNSQLWYRFDYAGDRSPITIRLVYGTLSGLSFNVFTQDGALNPGGGTPIGRGTAQAVFCGSGEPGFIQACLATDLNWVGGSRGSATYYVEVVNSNGSPLSFQLTVEGSGVTPGK